MYLSNVGSMTSWGIFFFRPRFFCIAFACKFNIESGSWEVISDPLTRKCCWWSVFVTAVVEIGSTSACFCDRWWFTVEFVNPYTSLAELSMFEWTSDCIDKKPFILPPSWLPTRNWEWECGGVKILRKLLLLGELRSSSMKWKVSLGVRFLDDSFGVNSCCIICSLIKLQLWCDCCKWRLCVCCWWCCSSHLETFVAKPPPLDCCKWCCGVTECVEDVCEFGVRTSPALVSYPSSWFSCFTVDGERPLKQVLSIHQFYSFKKIKYNTTNFLHMHIYMWFKVRNS